MRLPKKQENMGLGLVGWVFRVRGDRREELAILIAVAEKVLAAMLKLGAARAALVWRMAERADGLATRMQRAIEAMASSVCLGGLGGGGSEEGKGNFDKFSMIRQIHT